MDPFLTPPHPNPFRPKVLLAGEADDYFTIVRRALADEYEFQVERDRLKVIEIVQRELPLVVIVGSTWERRSR